MHLLFDYDISTPDCHPELPRGREYNKITTFGEGSLSYEEAMFLYGLVLGCKPDTIIETGTENGCSSIHLAKALKDQGCGNLICIEHSEHYVNRTNKNLEKYNVNDITEVIKTDSIEFLNNYKVVDNKHYMLFLDTTIQMRVQEFKIVKSKFPKGTIVAIHDTSQQHPCGKMNLDQETSEKWFHLPSPRGLSVCVL